MATQSCLSDKDISDGLKQGDARILAVILRQYGGCAERQLQARGIHCPADRDDILAEVLRKVWQGGHRFDPEEGCFRGWFAAVVDNAAIDFRRREKKHRDTVQLGDNAENVQECSVAEDDPPPLTPDMADLLEIVAGLPESDRRIVLAAAEADGGPWAKEVAEALGMSEPAVHAKRHRLLKDIEKEMVERQALRKKSAES